MARHVLRLSGRRVTTIFSDKLDLRALGSPKVARASEVEYDNDRGGWTVKFADGQFIMDEGETPKVFTTRQAALDAEVAELERRLLSAQTPEVVRQEGKDAEVLFF